MEPIENSALTHTMHASLNALATLVSNVSTSNNASTAKKIPSFGIFRLVVVVLANDGCVSMKDRSDRSSMKM